MARITDEYCRRSFYGQYMKLSSTQRREIIIALQAVDECASGAQTVLPLESEDVYQQQEERT